MKRLIQRLAAVATLLAATSVFAQPLPMVGGEAAWAPKSAAVPRLRLAVPAPEVRLSPVPESALAALREANAGTSTLRRRLLIGVTRELDVTLPPAVAWHA